LDGINLTLKEFSLKMGAIQKIIINFENEAKSYLNNRILNPRGWEVFVGL